VLLLTRNLQRNVERTLTAPHQDRRALCPWERRAIALRKASTVAPCRCSPRESHRRPGYPHDAASPATSSTSRPWSIFNSRRWFGRQFRQGRGRRANRSCRPAANCSSPGNSHQHHLHVLHPALAPNLQRIFAPGLAMPTYARRRPSFSTALPSNRRITSAACRPDFAAGTVRLHLSNQRAARPVQAERIGEVGGHLLDHHAQPAARDLAACVSVVRQLHRDVGSGSRMTTPW